LIFSLNFIKVLHPKRCTWYCTMAQISSTKSISGLFGVVPSLQGVKCTSSFYMWA
jgi:hypothetical protein